ncbi:CHY zinc finger protein [Leifsonia kafniensis]|uniref:CHY zinc finger protein n=1 Tax=Leifsonia kafniensis TaxID=475957 RepID=A0ABP7L1Z3_9MICO
MEIFGKPIDAQTRCVHYATEHDVVAIKFVCCERFYPCHLCHEQTADHAAQQWPADRQGEQAILCGVCQQTLSISTYLGVSACPHCSAEFNEGCRLHRHLYFEEARLSAVAPSIV